MFEIVEEEYKQFLYDFEVEGGLVFEKYISESDYEDDYSHNDIEEAQEIFTQKVQEYIHDKQPNKYVIVNDWCVFVMTVDEAQKRNVLFIDENTIK